MNEYNRQLALIKLDAMQKANAAELELTRTRAAYYRLRAQGYVVKQSEAARVRESVLVLQAEGYTITPPRRFR